MMSATHQIHSSQFDLSDQTITQLRKQLRLMSDDRRRLVEENEVLRDLLHAQALLLQQPKQRPS